MFLLLHVHGQYPRRAPPRGRRRLRSGTDSPVFRASESEIAMACLRDFTTGPRLLPEWSVPLLYSRSTRATLLRRVRATLSAAMPACAARVKPRSPAEPAEPPHQVDHVFRLREP